MMRFAFAAIVATGCGRVAFDPFAGDAGDVVADGTVDAPLPDFIGFAMDDDPIVNEMLTASPASASAACSLPGCPVTRHGSCRRAVRTRS